MHLGSITLQPRLPGVQLWATEEEEEPRWSSTTSIGMMSMPGRGPCRLRLQPQHICTQLLSPRPYLLQQQHDNNNRQSHPSQLTQPVRPTCPLQEHHWRHHRQPRPRQLQLPV